MTGPVPEAFRKSVRFVVHAFRDIPDFFSHLVTDAILLLLPVKYKRNQRWGNPRLFSYIFDRYILFFLACHAKLFLQM